MADLNSKDSKCMLTDCDLLLFQVTGSLHFVGTFLYLLVVLRNNLEVYPVLGEKVMCAAVFLHLYIVPYM